MYSRDPVKNTKLLVFFIVFMDPVVKPRGDTVGFTDPRNNAFPRRRE
ncbi:MAG: palindromic element RPE4 domain-containing protein [Rickettsia endosymbiont of Sceptobius lativentris]|nr:palindromic element RPE4 domain-containing protein [Rickettsia endosymbiont of Sceptobius lativentris]